MKAKASDFVGVSGFGSFLLALLVTQYGMGYDAHTAGGIAIMACGIGMALPWLVAKAYYRLKVGD